MTRRIEHIVTLDPDDFDALHTIYTNKGNADPIVNAYRRTLRATTPTWLPTTNSPLTRNHHPAEMTRYSPSTSRAIRRKYSRE